MHRQAELCDRTKHSVRNGAAQLSGFYRNASGNLGRRFCNRNICSGVYICSRSDYLPRIFLTDIDGTGLQAGLRRDAVQLK